MPLIPSYGERKQTIPGVGKDALQNVDAAGIVGEAITKLGKTGLSIADDVGDVIVKREKELKNQADTNLSIQTGVDLDEALFPVGTQVQKDYLGISAAGAMDFVKVEVDRVTDPILETVKGNAKVYNQALQHREARRNQVYNSTAAHQANEIKRGSVIVLDNTLAVSLKEAQLIPENVFTAITSYTNGVRAQLNSNIISAEEATRLDRIGTSAIVSTNIEARLAVDPIGAQTFYNGSIYMAQGDGTMKAVPVKSLLTDQAQEQMDAKLKPAVRKQIDEEKETNAYAAASETWPDAKTAMVEVLKPEFMKTHGLTINQAQNIAQSFSAIGAQRAREAKDLQEKNLDAVRAVAIDDPVKALKLVKTVEGTDPKDTLALQHSLESHQRQMAAMSSMERRDRLEMEDKKKAEILIDIPLGKFKSENELNNAITALGLSNTSPFLGVAKARYADYRKNSGASNFFEVAEKDWNLLIQTTKGTAGKRKYSDMKPKMLEALWAQMEKENIKSFDPKVSEIYRAIRKELTTTPFQKALGEIGSFFGGSGDSFVAPTSVRQSVTAPVLDEATARKRLEGLGIKGAAQDKQIKEYRDLKVIK